MELGEWPGGATLVCFVRRSITPVTADPTNPPPPSGPEFPAPPGPGGTRDEWRAWRDRQRDYVRSQWHSSGWYGGGSWPWFGGWAWFWGVALVVIGAYYLLFNLGLLGWLRGDVLWPVLLIVFGVFLLLRRGRGWWP